MKSKANDTSTNTSKKQKHVVNGGSNGDGQSHDAERDENGGSNGDGQSHDAERDENGGSNGDGQSHDAQRDENGGSNGDGQSHDTQRDEWVEFIKSELYSRKAKTETISISIRRVPQEFYQGDDERYKPCVISIGLFHRGKTNLENMEKRKWECLEAILEENKENEECKLNDYYIELKKLYDRAKGFYSGSEEIDSKEFMKMLLLDGCYIVNYLSQLSSDETWMDHQIWNDLLLLENQLPFFVLERIYCLVKNETPEDEGIQKGNQKLLNLALGFCNKVCATSKAEELSLDQPESRSFEHLLHLFRAFLFYKERDDWRQCKVSPISTIPSAIFLQEAGIEFKKRKVMDSVMDVAFKDGVLNITPLVIDTYTISRYRNVIAFEKLHPEIEPRFTAFVEFMDRIIDKSEDVALLKRAGIIKHALGSDEEVATVFNKLTSGTFDYLSSELEEVYRGAGKHCDERSNYWWATLWRDYFGSPWQSMSIAGIVLVLLLTFLSTFFSIYSYFRPPFAS